MTDLKMLLRFIADGSGDAVYPNQAKGLLDGIKHLEQESAQLKELSLKLCDAVENNDDLPPIKYALKCGYLVNKLREKTQVNK